MNLLVEINDSKYIDILKENLGNPFIINIHVFTTLDLGIDDDDKLITINGSENVTFSDYIDYANDKLNDEICMIALPDITFDESLMHITYMNIESKFLALNKWIKKDNDYEINPTNASQDAWCFKAPFEIYGGNFKPTNLGADNTITYLAMMNDYVVTNPSGQIVAKSSNLTNREEPRVHSSYVFVRPSANMETISENKIYVQ